MAVIYGSSVVTNGLVIYLDPANPRSYAGSGTTVNDISRNGFIGTLNGTVTYSSSNQGALTFDGSTGYVGFNQNTGTFSTMTVEMWVNLQASSPNGTGTLWCRSGSWRIMYSSNGVFSWACGTANNSWYSAGTTASTSTLALGNWYQVVAVYTGSNIQMYVNGAYAATSSGTISGNISGGSNLVMMQSDAGNIDYCKGSIGPCRIYSTALSASEVLQNFNTHRGRYGI